MYEHLEAMYKELLAKVSLMAPLLIKVEEILVATRTQRAPRLTSYYLHWEKKLFEAVGKPYNIHTQQSCQKGLRETSIHTHSHASLL